TVIPWRNGNERGDVTAPVTRTRDKYSCERSSVTITVTFGSRTKDPSLLRIASATDIGVRPPADTSPTSGTEIMPSGRTGTVTESSGFRQTLTWIWSSTPIRYALTGAENSASSACAADTHAPISNIRLHTRSNKTRTLILS